MFESNCIAKCQTYKAFCIPLSSKVYTALEACQGQSSLILIKSPYMMSQQIFHLSKYNLIIS